MNLAVALTLLRIILVPLVIYLIYIPANFAAALVFALVAATDYFDGYVARKYQQVTVLGTFLDPLADKLLVLSVLIVLAVQMRVEVFSVVILVAREFAIMGLRVIAASRGTVIAASQSAKYKTAFQMVALVLLLARWPYGLLLYYISFVIALYSLGEYFWQNRSALEEKRG